MASKTEEQKVRMWHERIQASGDKRDKFKSKYDWNGNLEKMKGFYAEIQGHSIPIPPINLVFTYVKTELARLYLRDPHIKVNPKKQATILGAKILEMALNHLWRTKRTKQENKKNIIDAKLVGHSWFKTGYTGKFKAVEDSEGNVLDQIESEDFFGMRINWEDVFFDVDSIDPPYDTRWIAHRYYLPLEAVQNDKAYKNTDKIKGLTKRKREDGRPRIDNRPESDIEMAELFEVFDKENDERFTIASGVDAYIKAPRKEPYHMKGLPFSYLEFNDDTDEPYGIPDVTMGMPQILELIKMSAFELDHVKRHNRVLMAKKNSLSPNDKALLESGKSGRVIEIDDPKNSIGAVPYAAVPPDAYAVEERLKEALTNVLRQSPAERGGTAKTTTRALGEVEHQIQGAQNSRAEQVDAVEDFIEDIAGNWVALLQQYADVPFYVSVTGKEPQEILQALQFRPSKLKGIEGTVDSVGGFTFTKEDIQGEFDVQVVAGSTVPLDRENKIKTIMELLKLAPQLGAVPGGPAIGGFIKIIAEELDMPEVQQLLDAELQAQQRQRQAASESQEGIQQQAAATEAAKLQMQAERIAIQKDANELNVLTDAAKLQQERELAILKAQTDLKKVKRGQ